MEPDAPGGPARTGGDDGRKGQSDAWAAFGLMVSGVLVWGGVGALMARWLGSPLFVMVGLLVGMTTALYAVWFRYGRS